MQKLISWPTSPFGAKVKACLKALDLYDQVEIVNYHPWQRDEELRRINPLNKIPVLVLKNGTALYDSPVICDYLNDKAEGNLIPKNLKFWVLKIQALCDGILDMAINARYETHFRPEIFRSQDWLQRQLQGVHAGIATLATEPLDETLSLATISAAVTLSYLDLRYPSMMNASAPKTLMKWHFDFLEKHTFLSDMLPSDTLPLPDNLISLIQ